MRLSESGENLRWSLFSKAKLSGAGSSVCAMAQDGSGFPRVMVAVVAEEDDLPAEFRLQAAGGADLGEEEAPREKPAGLLAEANHRAAFMPSGDGVPRRTARRSAEGQLKRASSGARRRRSRSELYQRYPMLG